MTSYYMRMTMPSETAGTLFTEHGHEKNLLSNKTCAHVYQQTCGENQTLSGGETQHNCRKRKSVQGDSPTKQPLPRNTCYEREGSP